MRTVPTDYHDIYPELNGYLIRPLLVNPPMCKLKELQDGTYSIADLEVFHQIIEMKTHMSVPAPELPSQTGSIY